MNFLIDAQLPRLLAVRLSELGHTASHTLDLEKGNRTDDRTISALAEAENAVVVSKDRDFLDSPHSHGESAPAPDGCHGKHPEPQTAHSFLKTTSPSLKRHSRKQAGWN